MEMLPSEVYSEGGREFRIMGDFIWGIEKKPWFL